MIAQSKTVKPSELYHHELFTLAAEVMQAVADQIRAGRQRDYEVDFEDAEVMAKLCRRDAADIFESCKCPPIQLQRIAEWTSTN